MEADRSKGLWNCQRVTYSNETRELMQMMMREARLNTFQQRQINNQLKKGGALPLVCNPTSSAPVPQPQLRVSKGPTLSARPQRRSAEMCSAGDSYTPETFRPCATRDLEKEKRRLQNILATGQEEPHHALSQTKLAERGAERESERDRFQEVLNEIEERRQFLEEMNTLGMGHQYNHIINSQISQKIRELEQIDRTRSEQLRTLMFKEEEK